MKKILALSVLLLLASGSYISARTIYDSTGRHIIYDATLRGQKRAAIERKSQQRMPAAAAAKINYEETSKLNNENVIKSNFYQDSEYYKAKHNIK